MTAPTRPDVTVREARDDDDLDALNAGNPQWVGQEQQRHAAAAAPAGVVLVLVGELNGAPAGYGFGIGAAVAVGGYGVAQVWVPAGRRRQGLGGALLAHLFDFVRLAGRPGVMVSVPDTEPDGLTVARHLGLSERGHHVESALDLTTLDGSSQQAALARAAAAGVVLSPLPQDAADAEWERVYACLSTRMRESPDASDGGGDMPYGVFRSFVAEPWQVLLAERAGEVVGLTCLMPRADAPHRLNTFFTGVRADARGHGVSTALKVEHARLVRTLGWREVWTQNMDQNVAIRTVNARLGYRPVGGSRDLGRAFS